MTGWQGSLDGEGPLGEAEEREQVAEDGARDCRGRWRAIGGRVWALGVREIGGRLLEGQEWIKTPGPCQDSGEEPEESGRQLLRPQSRAAERERDMACFTERAG